MQLLLEKLTREVNSTRGDNLHPPTLKILDQWGVLAALHDDGALPITELGVSHAQRGLIARFPLTAASEGPARQDDLCTARPDRGSPARLRHALASVSAEPGTVTGWSTARTGALLAFASDRKTRATRSRTHLARCHWL